MNYKRIVYLLGWIIKMEGVFMLPPFIASLIYKEKEGIYFIICAVCAVGIGQILTFKKPSNPAIYAREGFITTALSWIIMSIIGSLPYYLSGEIPRLIDAVFETTSGFTTTAATILKDVEALPRSMLLWRSFSNWIGGMGVLVFILAVLPLAKDGQSIHLMRAESPGPTVSKLVPKLRTTAITLYNIYIAMTVIQFVLLLFGKMPVFDALCISLGTAGTGGFAVLNSGIASYNLYLQIVITIFMILFGMNFTFYFLVLNKKTKDALQLEEIRWYLILYFLVAILIAINLTAIDGKFFTNFHLGTFQAASIMTTTGFSIVDYNVWPQFSKVLLILLMFIGACAGSTSGGIKVSRILIYLKTMKKELSFLIHQRSIKVIKINGKKVEHEVIRSANTFLLAYLMIFVFSVILVSLENFDLVTTTMSVVATLNNIGAGFELVGPTGNYSIFSDFTKVVFMFDMLVGRLEIFPMLLLFSKGTLRK